MDAFSYIIACAGVFGIIIGLFKMSVARHFEKTDPSRGTGYNFAIGVLILIVGFVLLSIALYLKLVIV